MASKETGSALSVPRQDSNQCTRLSFSPNTDMTVTSPAPIWPRTCSAEAAHPLTPAPATPGKPAFHQLLDILQEPQQLQQLIAVLARDVSSNLDGSPAIAGAGVTGTAASCHSASPWPSWSWGCDYCIGV